MSHISLKDLSTVFVFAVGSAGTTVLPYALSGATTQDLMQDKVYASAFSGAVIGSAFGAVVALRRRRDTEHSSQPR